VTFAFTKDMFITWGQILETRKGSYIRMWQSVALLNLFRHVLSTLLRIPFPTFKN